MSRTTAPLVPLRTFRKGFDEHLGQCVLRNDPVDLSIIVSRKTFTMTVNYNGDGWPKYGLPRNLTMSRRHLKAVLSLCAQAVSQPHRRLALRRLVRSATSELTCHTSVKRQIKSHQGALTFHQRTAPASQR